MVWTKLKRNQWCAVAVITFFIQGIGGFTLSSIVSSRLPTTTNEVLLLNRPLTALSLSSGGNPNDDDEALLQRLRSMRVKEIIAELKSLKASTYAVFGKEELVNRLFEAKTGRPPASSSAANPTQRQQQPVRQKIKKPLPEFKDRNIICGELSFISPGSATSVASGNSDQFVIEAKGQPYPTMTIRVQDDPGFDLRLLLDTACSGFVLQPSIVDRYNMPQYDAPATMTGASGSTGKTGLTQIRQFSFGGSTSGPLPAAVQEINALPNDLDGIIGLSYLNQFACVEMDMRHERIILYKTNQNPPMLEDNKDLQMVADGKMSNTALGIFTAETMIDDRGPVKMLVDSGATSSFLSWKAISDMGLSRDSYEIRRSETKTGAMGSDNVAMSLTHILSVENNIKFGARSQTSGLPVSYTVDIGDIPILDSQLAKDRVVGILGMDFFQSCSLIRMRFSGFNPKITVYN